MAHAKTRSIWDPQIVRTAVWDSVRKLHPRTMMKNPVMFVVEVGSVLTTGGLIDVPNGPHGFELQITWLWLTVRSNLPKPWPRTAGRRPTARKTRTETIAHRSPRQADRRRPPRAFPRVMVMVGGASSFRRRRNHRRHRVGRRIGHHRRVGARHPRVGWRPICRHRRDAGAVGLDQGARDRGPRPFLSRSHDRAGRRGGTPEDPERDRAQHPARGADDHLPARRRDGSPSRSTRARRSRCSCSSRCSCA